jgi:hypothetical protein
MRKVGRLDAKSCRGRPEITSNNQNKPEPEKGLNLGGSIINVASFVAIMGAATPQIACKLMGTSGVRSPQS